MKAYIEIISKLVSIVSEDTWQKLPYFPFDKNNSVGSAKLFDLVFFDSSAHGAVGFLWVEFEENLGQILTFPFRLARHSEDADLVSMKPWSLREASNDPLFYTNWKNTFLESHILPTELGGMFAVNYFPNNPFTLAINVSSESVNTSVRVESLEEFKIFRSFEVSEPACREVQVLEYLDSQKIFANYPKLHAVYSYSSDIVQNAHVAICMNYIENSGTLWRELVSLNRAQRTQVAGTNNTHALAENLLRSRSESLGRLFGEFHSAMAQEKGQNDSFLAIFNAGEIRASWKQELFARIRERLNEIFVVRAFELFELTNTHFDSQDISRIKSSCELLAKNFASRIDDCRNLGLLTRIHGNPHLGQILVSNDQLFLLDYEADKLDSVEFGRLKQSPLKDLACVVNSFQYCMAHESATEFSFDFAPSDSEIGKRLQHEFIESNFVGSLNAEEFSRSTKEELLELFFRFYHQTCRENAPSLDIVPPSEYEFSLLLNLHLFARILKETWRDLLTKNPRAKINMRFLESHCLECFKFFARNLDHKNSQE